MKKVMVLLAVVAVVAFAAQGRAGTIYTFDDEGPDHDWNTAANWNPDGIPAVGPGDTAIVGDGYTCNVDGNCSSAMHVKVGNAGGTGNIEVSVCLYVRNLYIGHGGNDGTVTVKSNARITSSPVTYIGGSDDGTENGTLTLKPGFKESTHTLVVLDAGDSNSNQAVWDIQGTPSGNGIRISGLSGQSGAPYVLVGLQFGGSDDAANNNVLYKAAEGTVITFTHCSHSWNDYYSEGGGRIWHYRNPSFVNHCTDDTETGLGDLNNTTFVYEGFSSAHPRSAAGCGTFEAGGEDMGAVMAGLNENFALAGLVLKSGDSSDNGAEIKLVDEFDNGNRSSPEAVYVKDLVLEAGTILHTNGINLYYLNGTIDPNATIDTSGGGGIYQIPEPATLALLGIGGCLVLLRRKK